jgi:hypothetical protein
MAKNTGTGTVTVTQALRIAADAGVPILSVVLYRAHHAGRIMGGRTENGRIFLEADSFDQWLKRLNTRRELFSHYRANRNGTQPKPEAAQ